MVNWFFWDTVVDVDQITTKIQFPIKITKIAS